MILYPELLLQKRQRLRVANRKTCGRKRTRIKKEKGKKNLNLLSFEDDFGASSNDFVPQKKSKSAHDHADENSRLRPAATELYDDEGAGKETRRPRRRVTVAN